MKINNHKSCDHIGIITNNYRKLVSFYTEKLEFRVEREEKLSKSVMRSVFGLASEGEFIRLVAGNAKIEIFRTIGGCLRKNDNRNCGYNHWAMHVGDQNSFLRELRRKGVRIIQIKRNDHSVYFMKDPDGNRIEIKD